MVRFVPLVRSAFIDILREKHVEAGNPTPIHSFSLLEQSELRIETQRNDISEQEGHLLSITMTDEKWKVTQNIEALDRGARYDGLPCPHLRSNGLVAAMLIHMGFQHPEIAVAEDPAEGLLGFDKCGCGPPQRHLAALPVRHPTRPGAHAECMESMRFVFARHRQSTGERLRLFTVKSSSSPLAVHLLCFFRKKVVGHSQMPLLVCRKRITQSFFS